MIVADDLTVEIAPGADLGADPSSWSWVDISTRVRHSDGVAISGVGRGGEAEDADTPSLTLLVENDTGDFSSRNPLGMWYPDLGVGTPIRVYWDTSGNVRFAGHISELPPRWTGDESGSDEVAVVRAAGVTRRLQQGEQALDSPLHRSLTMSDQVVAFWPCEDGSDATEAASPIDGVAALVPSGVEFGASREQSESTLFGASKVMKITDGARNVLGRVPNHTPGDVYVVELAWLMPETATDTQYVMNVHATTAKWQLLVSSTQFTVRRVDPDGTVAGTASEAVGDVFGRWVRAELRLNLSLNQSTAHLFAVDTGQTELNRLGAGGAPSDTRVVRAGVLPSSSQERYAAHIAVLTGTEAELPLFLDGGDVPTPERHDPFHGWTGELAADRFERLCDEQGLSCSISAPTGGLRVPGGVFAATSELGSNASTPDAAGLDITGDIDVRAWVAPELWEAETVASVLGKWAETGDERSWRLTINSTAFATGTTGIQFSWRTDGTNGTGGSFEAALAPVPPDHKTGFLAIRATLDVDDGASGHVGKLYVGPSLDGPWTEFHSKQDPAGAGTTSIYSGTAALTVGSDDDGDTDLDGIVREARVYDGIAGTLVASPDFTAQTVGATSFDDAQGNTWTLNVAAAIVRADDSMPMGPQAIDTLTNNMQACEDADGGILSEADFGLVYRTRTSLYNQTAALALSQPDGELAAPPEPTDDDRHIRNDITATRPDGTSVRAVDSADVTEHGRYDESTEANVSTDDWLRQMAYWRLHLGTVDEYRWPRLDIALHADQDLIDDWLAVEVGDRITVDHDIAQLAGVDIDLIVVGWSERFDQFTWDVVLNCTSASPYDVAVFGTSRFDAEDSSTSGSFVAGTDTSLTVTTAAGHQPFVNSTDHASEFPFEIAVAGVVLNVTAISSSTSPQTFTVDQTPVNGVTKTIASGSAVKLADTPVFAL